MKKVSKILSLLIAIIMVIGMIPMAYAAGPASGPVADAPVVDAPVEDAPVEDAPVEEVAYVAQIDDDKYETLQAAADVGGKIVMIDNVELDDAVVITKNATINLNGKSVISQGDAFEIKAGATLTISGSGKVVGGQSGVGSWTAIWANGGAAVLNGGSYAVGGDRNATDATHQNDLIYTKNGGTVVINGGNYKNNGTIWTLNENDANRGTITVYGGVFEGWDPANNVSEGAGTSFVADGYVSVKDGNNYVVEKADQVMEEDPNETPDPIRPEECKHENKDKKVVEPTCEEDGLYYIYCHDCEKEVMNTVLPATGHNMVADKIEPTCTEDGLNFSACDKCGEKSAFQSVIPALGHDFKDGECAVCGAPDVGEDPNETPDPIRPVECKHENKDKKVKEATCEEDGLYYIYCHDCEKEVMNTVLPATGHDFEDGKCAACGALEVGEDPNETPDPIRPVECKHENKDKKVVEPTCEEDGLYYIYCHDCEKEVMNTVLPATGHNWVANKVEPTCTVDGLEYSACDKCGEKSAFQAVIPALGHDFEDGKCAACGAVDANDDADDSDDALLDCGHKYVELARKDATCTEDGYIDHDCDKHCGKSFRREILAKTGHNWVADKVEPTCTEDGHEFSVCDKCGEKSLFQKVIPAKGHDFEDGKCTVCGELEEKEEQPEEPADPTDPSEPADPTDPSEPAAHEHKLTKVEAKKATCTEKGAKEHYACECGKLFEDKDGEKEITDKTKIEIKAVGHTAEKKWTRSHKQHWHKCSVCGEITDEKEDHEFDKKTGKICQICAYDVDDPKTGDEFNMGLMIAMIMFSIVGMGAVAGVYVYNKKRK